nr:hypothetical protein CFP56_65958 [Quercus suber]
MPKPATRKTELVDALVAHRLFNTTKNDVGDERLLHVHLDAESCKTSFGFSCHMGVYSKDMANRFPNALEP